MIAVVHEAIRIANTQPSGKVIAIGLIWFVSDLSNEFTFLISRLMDELTNHNNNRFKFKCIVSVTRANANDPIATTHHSHTLENEYIQIEFGRPNGNKLKYIIENVCQISNCVSKGVDKYLYSGPPGFNESISNILLNEFHIDPTANKIKCFD